LLDSPSWRTVAAARRWPAPTIDSFIAQHMNEARIVGLGVAIIVDKKVVGTKSYGFADKERAVPFTSDTVLNIGRSG
jgi:CubicO group peptidase (beta-lactamase class C family)